MSAGNPSSAAARVAKRAPMPALQSCLFLPDAVVVTDLDLALRAQLSGARDVSVLVPANALKRCLLMRGAEDIQIGRAAAVLDHPFMSIGGAVFPGNDPAEFPDVTALFPSVEPIARAKMGSLEPVLVAASTDETRKSFCAVFFQLCRNLAVATNGHVLHTTGIFSSDEGDFLVPRNAIELVENIRRGTKTNEVEVNFFDHQAVFRIGRFEVASRLEEEKFPAWEEVLPKKSKYELRVPKRALLEALDKIAAAIGNRSSGVQLRRAAKGLEIHGAGVGGAQMTAVLEASGWDDDQVVSLNISYLYDAARFVASEELHIGITDQESPLAIEDAGYAAYVMPMRLER